MARVSIRDPEIRFILIFVMLFGGMYGFYIFYVGIVSPGNYYSQFLADHLNFIQWLRVGLLKATAGILTLFGYKPLTNSTELMVVGHNIIIVNNSCLAIGIMCFFIAFVVAYPGNWRSKLIFTIAGLLIIQALNITRFVLLSLFFKKGTVYIADQHTIYNIIVYIIIAVSLYFWIKKTGNTTSKHATN